MCVEAGSGCSAGFSSTPLETSAGWPFALQEEMIIIRKDRVGGESASRQLADVSKSHASFT